jgi:hypothetical protein
MMTHKSQIIVMLEERSDEESRDVDVKIEK